MALLNILKYPEEKLKNPSEAVVKFDNKLVKLINDMFETMYINNAIGLAATQVDIHKQLITIDISNSKIVLVNPVLLEVSGKAYPEEACLSIPNIVDIVVRSKNIYIGAFDVKGYMYRIKAKGILAICIQHEVEHLVGLLTIYKC